MTFDGTSIDGGLLARPVVWLCYDDRAGESRSADLYRRFMDEDKVDRREWWYRCRNCRRAGSAIRMRVH